MRFIARSAALVASTFLVRDRAGVRVRDRACVGVRDRDGARIRALAYARAPARALAPAHARARMANTRAQHGHGTAFHDRRAPRYGGRERA